MTPERWQHLKGLLHSVLARKPEEREAFLAEVCGDDAALREDLESLLAHEAQADSFIAQPAFGVMAETLTNEDAMSMLGRTLGRYRILAALGSGGMGEVYVAEDTQLGRKIALKTLTAHFTMDDERVRRFQQEARAASALNHPNIITIYEIGEIDSRHFIVTELIEGETLRLRMAKAPMVISEALDVATQLASALTTAHHAGIVHRDIKPENIMLRADGIAKVLDFGLAKLTEQKNLTSNPLALFETAPGAVMGTAHYMSPEQARGLSVDARTDIWSLGVVLFEMVGGRVPFEGATSSDVIASILNKEPTSLARYSPEAPTELEWIVRKALRKDREERYQTAKELLSDLKGLKRRLEFEQDLERSAHSGPQSIYSRHVSAEADHAGSQSQTQSSREVAESLAVLPLVNKCADPNMDYLSDGITESITNALSKLTQLRVMAWSTVSRYKGKEIDPRDIGRQLNVRAVLTGRLMQLGEQLSISTELVDVMDGSHLWGESYRCQPAEILDIAAEISSEISEKLLLRLTTDERKQLTKRYTDNVEAYHAYLRGRYCWNKRTDEGLRKAIEHFNHAIDNDPGYALAYTGLADSYIVLGSFGIAIMSPEDAFPKAREAALRALEIDDTLAEAHASLAYSLANYDWNWPAAEKEFKRCFELKPGYATAHHWFGFIYLTAVGFLDQAIAETRHALNLAPLSLPVSANVGLLLYLARRYDEAIDQLQQTLELDQNFVYSHWHLALAYEQKQMYHEAIAEFQKAISLSGRSTLPIALLGHAYAVSGRKSEALAILDQLSQLPKQRYVSPYRVAAIYAGLQDKDRAFYWLERAFEGRDGWLIWLHLDPVMENISSDRRFTELLHRVLPTRSANSETTKPPPVLRAPEIAREPSAGAPAHSTMLRPWLARRTTIIVALGLIALLAAVAYLLLQRSNRSTKDAAAPKPVTFMQLTNQPGPEFFPSLSGDGGSFAYASRTSGNWDIYVQPVGGATPVNLTQNSLADDTQPAFSPAGDRIAFRSERDGGGIFLMGVSGESVVRVSDFGYSPAWSPDGQQILVGTEKIPQPSTRPSKSQLWAINTRTNERRLISEGDALQPNCSPHGNRIAFWSRPSRTGQRDRIWTVPAEGGDAVAVTAGTVSDSNPVWSPDGKFLYFSSNRGGSVNIWRVPIDEKSGVVLGEPEAVTTIGAATSALYLSFSRDGRRLAYIAQEEIRNLRKVSFDPSAGKVTLAPVSITRGSMQLWFPDVSPDGEWLTCQSMGNQRHIFIMRTDGSEIRNLTDDTFGHFWPRWSPDGKRIAFSSRRSGNYEIWSINRDGSGLQQLTRDHGSPGAHYSPWSPDGNRIAYSVHVPRNECVLFEPDKAWSEQKLEYLPPLADASISFEGWSWSRSGTKLAGIKHLPNGVHSGIGIYDLASKSYDWFTDFGDWPVWLNDERRLLFVSEGKIFLFDTKTRKHQQILKVTDQDIDIGSPGLSPENRTLYFTFVAAEADIWLMTLE